MILLGLGFPESLASSISASLIIIDNLLFCNSGNSAAKSLN